MRYPVLSPDRARDWWFQWKRKCESDLERVPPPACEGAGVRECEGPADFENQVNEAISELANLYDDQAEFANSNRLEAEASVAFHSRLEFCEALADPEFWIWCAVVAAPELVSRRYPLTEAQKSNLLAPSDMSSDGTHTPSSSKSLSWIPGKENFFSPNARETFFYRLWIRGQLGRFDEEADPYELARCGDIDFWRSHIFRQQSLEASGLRAEFIRFQYPDGPNGSPRLNQGEIRSLIKQMKRAAANEVFEHLDREQCRNFIERQWTEVSQ